MGIESEVFRWKISNPRSRRVPDFYNFKSRCLTLRKEWLVSSYTQRKNSWFSLNTVYDNKSWGLRLTDYSEFKTGNKCTEILIWSPPNNGQKHTEKEGRGWQRGHV
jgi:hypothetical protein